MIFARVAQLVGLPACTRVVAGSNPASGSERTARKTALSRDGGPIERVAVASYLSASWWRRRPHRAGVLSADINRAGAVGAGF